MLTQFERYGRARFQRLMMKVERARRRYMRERTFVAANWLDSWKWLLEEVSP